MVTIRDVAERAGVSLGTASRVLNGNPTVRPQVREAVEIAIRELNYVPNAAARTLRSTRTRTIGVILPDLLNPMTVRLLRGVEDAARGRLEEAARSAQQRSRQRATAGVARAGTARARVGARE